jgi:hypothetical protein
MLYGRVDDDGVVTVCAFLPCDNVDPGAATYGDRIEFDGDQVLATNKWALESLGLVVVGWFHNHPEKYHLCPTFLDMVTQASSRVGLILSSTKARSEGMLDVAGAEALVDALRRRLLAFHCASSFFVGAPCVVDCEVSFAEFDAAAFAAKSAAEVLTFVDAGAPAKRLRRRREILARAERTKQAFAL